MAPLTVTQRGHDNWASLNREQKLKAADWVAERLAARGDMTQVSLDVLDVGAGYRERKGTRDDDLEVVLVASVRNKSEDVAANAIPAHIQEIVPTRDHRLVMAIPTDVRHRPRRPEAQAKQSAANVRSAGRRIYGSLAVLVKNAGGQQSKRYAMSCEHVAFATRHLAGLPPGKAPIAAFHESDSEWVPAMGIPRRRGVLKPSPKFSIDVGLIDVDAQSPARHKTFWQRPAVRWPENLTQLEVLWRLDTRLYTRHNPSGSGSIFLASHKNFEIQYKGDLARFREIIEYEVDRATSAGDSGGGLITSNSSFLAMHLAGEGNRGFAIPAYRLMGTAVFSPGILMAWQETG